MEMKLRCVNCGKDIEGEDSIVFTSTKLEIICGSAALVEFPACSAICAIDAKRKNFAFWKNKLDVLEGTAVGTCKLSDFFLTPEDQKRKSENEAR